MRSGVPSPFHVSTFFPSSYVLVVVECVYHVFVCLVRVFLVADGAELSLRLDFVNASLAVCPSCAIIVMRHSYTDTRTTLCAGQARLDDNHTRCLKGVINCVTPRVSKSLPIVLLSLISWHFRAVSRNRIYERAPTQYEAVPHLRILTTSNKSCTAVCLCDCWCTNLCSEILFTMFFEQ